MRARSAVIPALLLVALTACGSDSDDPKIDEPPPRVIGCVADTDFGTTPATGVKLSFLGRYESGVFVGSAAEIPAFDAASKRGFIVNSQAGELDVLDLTDPSRPAKVDAINAAAAASSAGASTATAVSVNSVAIQCGLVAIAIESAP
ncbi:MAG: hypothetical protein WCX93_13410, partial [Burkholderiaceae bacterium]